MWTDAISLADIASAAVRLRPLEAVTIVRALVTQAADGQLAGIPSAHVIRLTASGAVRVEGPVVASGRPVPRAAHLLMALLPESKLSSGEPTPLGQVIAQALQDVGSYRSLAELAAALAPFGAQDSESVIADLTARWAEASRPAAAPLNRGDQATAADDPAESTLSKMRHARRDTGLSLDEVSRRSRIPVSMLRQLEWGYLRHWPRGLYGRTQLVRYARAAGLDRQLVLEAMEPMLLAEHHGDALDVGPTTAIDRGTGEPVMIELPQFEGDEGLLEFGAEYNEPRVPATPAVPRPALAPLADAPVPPAAVARPVPAPAVAPPAARVSDPLDVPLVARHPPGALLDPSTPAVQPHRASLVASAAVLSLATLGALWGMSGGTAGDARPGVAHSVRHLPARGQTAADRETPRSLPARQETAPLVHQPARIAVPALPITGVVPEAGSRLVPVDANADDVIGSPAAFASAGGVAFADSVPASGSSNGLDSDLGLRITRVVDDHARNYHARPSPDGSRVAFDSDRDGERAVFVAEANGRHLRRVSGEGFAAVPSWSPDGRTLAYVRAEVDNPNVWNVWALDLENGESRRLTAHSTGRPLGASWFPDGQRIAYSRGSEIVVFDVISGAASSFASPEKGRSAGPPAVSPDGRWAIFEVTGDGAWLLDLTTGASSKLLSDSTLSDFTWSPDGRRVAYYSRQAAEWNVWRMAAR